VVNAPHALVHGDDDESRAVKGMLGEGETKRGKNDDLVCLKVVG